MNGSIISLIAVVAFATIVSAHTELSEGQQNCMNQAMEWMGNIPTTNNIDNLIQHVNNLIAEEAKTGVEVRVGEQSAETTRDCGIYTSIMKAILLFTSCGDETTAYDVFNKLLASEEDDSYMSQNPEFANVFHKTIVCDAHVQTQIEL